MTSTIESDYYLNDLKWHGHYVAPDGVEGEPCRHAERRCGIGPTGNKVPMFSADVCWRCGRILRSVRDISWRQYFWVRRHNDRGVS